MEWSEEEERKEREKAKGVARVEVFILARTSQKTGRTRRLRWRGILDRHGGEAEGGGGVVLSFSSDHCSRPIGCLLPFVCLPLLMPAVLMCMFSSSGTILYIAHCIREPYVIGLLLAIARLHRGIRWVEGRQRRVEASAQGDEKRGATLIALVRVCSERKGERKIVWCAC